MMERKYPDVNRWIAPGPEVTGLSQQGLAGRAMGGHGCLLTVSTKRRKPPANKSFGRTAHGLVCEPVQPCRATVLIAVVKVTSAWLAAWRVPS